MVCLGILVLFAKALDLTLPTGCAWIAAGQGELNSLRHVLERGEHGGHHLT